MWSIYVQKKPVCRKLLLDVFYNGLESISNGKYYLPLRVHIIRSYPENQCELVHCFYVYSPLQKSESSCLIEYGYGDAVITKVLCCAGHTAIIIEATDTTHEIYVRGTSVLADSLT